jgi:hemoglobin
MTQENESTQRTDSLWDRLGGEAGVDALLVAFYDRVLADPELAPFFRETSLERLRKMQRGFFSSALGGPVEYGGRTLAHAHHDRGIEAEHLRRFVEHLLATLESIELSDEDRQTVYSRIHMQADDVLGRTRGLGG